MAMNGLPASFGPVESARPEITPYHIQFALARRPATSWQNIGKMLGVCAFDLQRRCEEPHPVGREAAVVTPLPKPAKDVVLRKDLAERGEGGVVGQYRPKHVRAGSLQHAALTAVGAGAGETDQVARAIRRNVDTACAVLYTLVTKGFILTTPRPGLRGKSRTVRITDAGLAELKRFGAGAAE
jgi:hypothetical protein